MSEIYFPFERNADKEFKETWDFKTDVLRSHSGKEQRRCLAYKPRKSISFTVMESGSKAMELALFVKQNRNNTILVPDWCNGMTTLHPVTPFSNRIYFSNPKFRLENSQKVVIQDDNGNYEIIAIDYQNGPTDFSMIINSVISETWAAGCRVYPLLKAHFSDNTDFKYFTAEVCEVDFDFKIDNYEERETDQFVYIPRHPYMLNDKPVLMERPNYKDIGIEFEQVSDLVEFQSGIAQWFSKEKFGTLLTKGEFYGLSERRNEILIDFVKWSKGRFKEFYMPSMTNDFKSKNQHEIGDNRLYVEKTIYGIEPDKLTDKRIVYTTASGLVFNTRISNYWQHEPTDQYILYLEDNFETDEDIVSINFLNLTRLASDKIEFRWITNSVFKLTLSFQQLPTANYVDQPPKMAFGHHTSTHPHVFSSFNRIASNFIGQQEAWRSRYIESGVDNNKFMFEFEILDMDANGLEVGIVGFPGKYSLKSSIVHSTTIPGTPGVDLGYGEAYGYYVGASTPGTDPENVTYIETNFVTGDIVTCVLNQVPEDSAYLYFYVNRVFKQTLPIPYLPEGPTSNYRPFVASLEPSVKSKSVVKLNTGQEHFRVFESDIKDWY